jgi:hypothetical protein
MVGPMPPDTLNPKYPPRTEHRPAIAVLDVTIFNPTLDPTGGSRTRGSMRSSPGSPPEIDQRMSASGEGVWRPARPPWHPAATARAPLQTHRAVRSIRAALRAGAEPCESDVRCASSTHTCCLVPWHALVRVEQAFCPPLRLGSADHRSTRWSAPFAHRPSAPSWANRMSAAAAEPAARMESGSLLDRRIPASTRRCSRS